MAGERIVIVGGGLAGGLLACMLGRKGYRVTLYERRPDPRQAGFIGGRSINLALSCRGITALERVGLAGEVLRDAIPMPGRMMHDPAGRLTFQPYSKDASDAINSVSRGQLNITLLNAAEASGAEIIFGQRCVDADLDAPAAELRDESTGATRRVECDVLVGSDGAFSAVRSKMQRTDRFDYSQTYLGHGYKELRIPPASECGIDPARFNGFAMDPSALHIWPRGGFMMIALPNADRSFTCTLFWPFDGEASFAAVSKRADVLPFFHEHFADAVPLMPTLVEDYLAHAPSSLATIRCAPWNVAGRVVLIGDASHAIVPFYGQGINAGFEDCRVFDALLDQHAGGFDALLPAFSASRKPHADAIADLAIENFEVMRDKVADAAFLARKRVEQVMHSIDAERYTPLYNLISFSNTPYAEARERGNRVIELAEKLVRQIGVSQSHELSEPVLAERLRSMLAEQP